MRSITKDKKDKIKIRKQMRISDVYRFIVTEEIVLIKGIKMYKCTEDYIEVRYEGEYATITYFTKNEQQRKEAITKINSKL